MTATRRRPAFHQARSATEAQALGPVPRWNLADLYAGMDAPAFAADLDRAGQEAERFAADYRSRLAGLAGGPDGSARLAEAVERYEALDEALGRAASYAQLLYTEDTSDPARAKFMADAQDRVTTVSSNLLFFTLELNALPDETLDRLAAAAAAGALPALARRHPEGPAAPARDQARTAVPREGRDGPRRLDAALRRDHHGAALPRERR